MTSQPIQLDRKPANTGFSLIELLVVISIIAIMVSLVLPTLAASRETSQRVQCLSQLRQMGLFSEVYLSDHAQSFVPAYDFTTRSLISWEITTLPDGSHQPGTLFQGHGDPALQQCPSFLGPDNWSNAPYTGYNYNTSYLGHGTFEINPKPAMLDDVRSPAATAIFGDGQWASGANKFMRAPNDDTTGGGDMMSKTMRAAGTQGYRHQQRTNVLAVDGHGLTISAPEITSATEPFGFLSIDNDWYDLR